MQQVGMEAAFQEFKKAATELFQEKVMQMAYIAELEERNRQLELEKVDSARQVEGLEGQIKSLEEALNQKVDKKD